MFPIGITYSFMQIIYFTQMGGVFYTIFKQYDNRMPDIRRSDIAVARV